MTRISAEAVVIGASAGAVEALSIILPSLPIQYGLPIIIVVHLPPDKKSILPGLFQGKCTIAIGEAEDKELICAGKIYFAPPDYHLLVETDKSLSLSSDKPVLYSRPSIDVLFESAADAYGPTLVAVLLTGANQDGTDGMRAVVESGGMAIIQRPDTAFAPAMPEAAIAACPDAHILSLEEIASYLQGLAKV